MNIKKTQILVLTFFLLSVIFPYMSITINSIADDSLSKDDVTKFDDVLIDEPDDYISLGFDFDKIVDPVFYEQENICEAHLPLGLNIDMVKQFVLEGKNKNDFLSCSETGKKGFEDIVYKYRILVNESFSYPKKIYTSECWNYSVFDKENNSFKIFHKCQDNYSKTVMVDDYRYVWKDVKSLSSISFKTKNKIVIDIQGNYQASVKRRSVDVIPNIKIGGFSKSLDKYAWWDSNWLYKKTVTIDSDGITGGDATLNNFPLLIYIPSDSDLASNAQADGDDIAFVDSGESSQYNHEIEVWDSGTGELLAWVNITSLIHTGNMTMYMYYGNAGASNQENREDTWNSDYVLVHHLNGSKATDCDDSTSNNNDVDDDPVDPSYQQTGKFGYCIDFDAGNNRVTIPDSNSLDITGDITIEAWIEPDRTGGNSMGIVSKRIDGVDDSYGMYSDSGKCGIELFQSGSRVFDMSTNIYTLSEFSYMVGRYDGSTLLSSIDDLDTGGTSESGAHDSTTCKLNLGWAYDNSIEYDGKLDEVRISKVARSDTYIWSTYNSSNWTTKYRAIGAETTDSGTSPEFSNPSPVNGSTFVSFTGSGTSISIDVNDPEGDNMNVSFYSNSSGTWQVFGDNESVGNGTVTQVNSNFSSSDTKYWWNVSLDDGSNDNNSAIYHFTTIEGCTAPTSFTVDMFNDVQLNLSWSKGTNATHTRIQRKTTGYPTSVSDGTNVYNSTGVTYDDTGLSGSQDYFYRAWSYNSTINEFSSGYVSAQQETLPSVCTGFSASPNNESSIGLSWSKGTGADKTVIRYYTGGYPSSPTNGTQAYNDTGTSTDVDGLNSGTMYYFRAWSFDSSSNFSLTNASDSATTSVVPSSPSNLNVSSNSSTLMYLNWSEGNGTQSVVVRKTGGYPSSHSDGTEVYNGTSTQFEDSSLSISTQYYYNVYSYNNTLYSAAVQDNNWTFPQVPQNATGEQETGSYLNITWDNASGADTYVIVRKNSGYPSSRSDGTEVYNNSNWWYNDTGYSDNDYYSMWSYNNSSKLYSSLYQLLWGGLVVNVYNETSELAISNWDIFITNKEGDNTSEYTSQSNGQSYDINTIPHGDETAIIINATGYDSRTYYMDLDPNEQYTLDAYLTPTPSSYLYLITVVNQYGEPVKNAKIIFKKSIGGSYKNVSVMYTDASGQVSLKLTPDILYKVVISKSGYNTEYSDYRPSDSIYTHEFEIEFSGEYPDIITVDDIIDFTASIDSSGVITIEYEDNVCKTIDTHYRIYEVYNGSMNLNTTFDYTTNCSLSFTSSGYNISRVHQVKIYINHSDLDTNPTILYYTIPSVHTLDDEDRLDNYWIGVFGDNPLGWTKIFIIFLPCLFLLIVLGKDHVGMGIISSGLWMGFTTLYVDIGNSTTLVSTALLLLVVGAITIIVKKGRETV